jgi:putative ABC transport system ATP-binding protein
VESTNPLPLPAETIIRTARAGRVFQDQDRAEVPALQDVTFEIPRGEFVAIMGPSGSGKSTLLNLLGGLDRPTSGRVEVGGLDLGRATEQELDRHRRETVGFVFQSFHLNPRRTTLENVILPLVFSGQGIPDNRTRGLQCLDLVGLADLAWRSVSTLSGGQRQRVALARALVNSPQVLLADEPVGNLDAVTGTEIVDLLAALNQEQGITIVAVSHDTRLLRMARRTIRLVAGHVEPGNGSSVDMRDIAPPHE